MNRAGETDNQQKRANRLRRFVVQEELALIASGKVFPSDLNAEDSFRAGLLNHMLYKAQICEGKNWIEEEREKAAEGQGQEERTTYGWFKVTAAQLREETLNQRDCKTIRKYLGQLSHMGYVRVARCGKINQYRVGLRRLCADLLGYGLAMDSRVIFETKMVNGQKISKMHEYRFPRLCAKLDLDVPSSGQVLQNILIHIGLDKHSVQKDIPRLAERVRAILGQEDSDLFLRSILEEVRSLHSLEDVGALLKRVLEDVKESIQTWRNGK